MTREDLFRAIGGAEEKDLLRARKKHISPIIWIATLAAMLLAVCLLINREEPIYRNILEEKPSWNMQVDIHVSPEAALLDDMVYPKFLVHARVLEALPDTYLIPEKTLNRERCRVLRLQVVQTLFGKDVPRELYYILPEQYYTDMTGLDLIISMEQLGVENYLLLNTTQQQYETFSLLFADFANSNERDIEPIPDPTKVSTCADICNIIPFRNNRLYWPQDEAWAYAKSYFEYLSANGDIPVTSESTLSEAKAALRQAADTERPKVRYADEYNIGIALTDADTPKEGVFSQIIHRYEKKILLCRIIDGFYANECYMYYEDGRIEASDVKFTKEDIAKLPKLVPVIDQVLEKAPEKGTCRKLVGYYYKTDSGELYGVIQAIWETDRETDLSVNMLVSCDGTVEQISTAELNQRLQETR